GRTFVVAFGGELFTERQRFLSFVHDLNLLDALGIRLVLVHGARPQIEADLKARGVRSRYAQGLRITDDAALIAVKQAAGVLRIEIEAVLSQGLRHSPMAGAQIRVNSGNFITARPIGVRKGVDFLYTGSVRKVDAFAIRGALDHAVRALASGVGRAHLVSRRVPGSLLLELFTQTGVGTMVTADTLEKLRPARIEDVGGMLTLIEPLEADGTLVKRSRELLE